MSDGHTGIGHIFVDEILQVYQIADAVVHEKHLSVAAHLKVDGIGNHFFVKGMHLGVDGIAVRRRCLHHAHVSCPHQRKLQGARNGRGTHGECVHIGLHLAQFFFHGHAKLLFLVNDEQSQILEFHRLAYQFVCTHDDVDLARLKVGKHILGLLGGACP